MNKKRSLLYYHIQYGGVPITDQGIKRFIFYALLGGYSKKEIEAYLKDLK